MLAHQHGLSDDGDHYKIHEHEQHPGREPPRFCHEVESLPSYFTRPPYTEEESTLTFVAVAVVEVREVENRTNTIVQGVK